MAKAGAGEALVALTVHRTGVKMKEIALDASAWRDRDGFYEALLPALGAPAWHGRNLDALKDSLCGEGILATRSPFRIRIANSASVPAALQEHLFKFADLVTDLRTNHDCEVYLMLE